jgi:hypothetical protein
MARTTRISFNAPTEVADAVNGISAETGINRTDIIVGAIVRDCFYRRIAHDDPAARVQVQHSDGRTERVAFLPPDLDPLWAQAIAAATVHHRRTLWGWLAGLVRR